jgi:hypothetical protein
MNSQNNVAVLELRRLLFELKDLRPDICIRLRQLGAMWQPSFCQVVKMTETGVIMCDTSTSEFCFIKNLNNVVQFELDSMFQSYHPHYHYSIQAVMTLESQLKTAN